MPSASIFFAIKRHLFLPLFYFLSGFFLLFTSFAEGKELSWQDHPSEGFEVAIKVQDDSVHLNENLKVTLELRYPEHYNVDLSELSKHLIHPVTLDSHSTPPFSIAQQTEEKVINEDKSVRQTIQYELEPWEAGTFPLSFLDINFFSDEGWQRATFSSYSEVFEVEVKPPFEAPATRGTPSSLLPFNEAPVVQISEENKRKLQDNENKIDEERDRRENLLKQKELPWRAVVWIILILLLVILARRLGKDLLKRGPEAAVPLDPRQKALEAMRKLKTLNLPDKGEYDPFFLQLSQIVRIYIEEKYDIRAPERTTQEFLSEIAHANQFTPKIRQELEEFLSYADMVKFAKLGSSPEDCYKAENAAKQFIGER